MSILNGILNVEPNKNWLQLPVELQKIAVFPTDTKYNYLRSVYMKKGNPSLILMAENEEDVIKSVLYIKELRKYHSNEIPFSVRSGGHGMSGSSTNVGGVILDISKMNRIKIEDIENKLVRVQAGAKWGTVAQKLAPYDLVITSGNFGDVGVGGLASSGGIGFFIRSQGLTIDRIREVTLITSDGKIHKVNNETEPELYWGVRGGATQLGVVTEILFEAEQLNSESHNASVIFQNINYSTTNIAQFVNNWGTWINNSPLEMTSFLMIQKSRDNFYGINVLNVWSGTDVKKATPVLEKALSLTKIVSHSESIIPYPNIIPHPQALHMGQQKIKIKNVLVDKIDIILGNAIEKNLQNPVTVMVELRSLGGKMNDISTEETAWGSRKQEAFVASWFLPRSAELQKKAFDPLEKIGTGVYGAYSSDISKEIAQKAWSSTTGYRLQQLIDKFDPTHLFNEGIHL